MKNLGLLFIAIIVMAFTFTLPACGDGYEKPADKKFGTKQMNEKCTGAGDCVDGLFCNDKTGPQGMVCLPNHCKNAVKDDDETGVDCGGSCNEAYRCANSLPCSVGRDCISGKCSAGYCAVLENGEPCEFDLACRSQVCNHATGKCSGGSTAVCTSNSDCSSGAKVCFTDHCGDCVNDAQCGGNLVCRTGSCESITGSCTGGCPQGQSCVQNACQVVPFGGTPTVNRTVICWGYPQSNGTTPSTTVSATANTLFICPTDFDGSFTSPVGVQVACYNGKSVNNGTNSGTLSSGAYGCAR